MSKGSLSQYSINDIFPNIVSITLFHERFHFFQNHPLLSCTIIFSLGMIKSASEHFCCVCWLQLPSIVTDVDCTACDFNRPGKNCLRKLEWVWRGETYMAKKKYILQTYILWTLMNFLSSMPCHHSFQSHNVTSHVPLQDLDAQPEAMFVGFFTSSATEASALSKSLFDSQQRPHWSVEHT